MTSVYVISAESLAGARAELGRVVSTGTDGVAAAKVGSELFGVTEVLAGDRMLRGALTDPSAPPAERAGLAESLFGAKVDAQTLAVLRAACEQRWSAPLDLVDAVEILGREALLVSADQQGQLATVEDELFRLGRIIDTSPELQSVLTDRNADPAGKQQVMASLLYGKVTAVTSALVAQAVGRLQTAPADAFDDLSAMAAERRDLTVAHVRSATEVSELQRQRLAETLERLYGRALAVHVEVDPELIGGLVVRVGDEVIDGSAAGRLAAVRNHFD